MESRLPRGHFCGEIIKRREVAGFLFTETRYPASLRLPSHAHENGYICLIRQGAYSETFGRRSRLCRPMTLAFHPPDERHAEEFHAEEVRSFNIEVSPAWRARVADYSRILEQPAEFQGGLMAWLAVRLYNEFSRMDEVSPLAIEGIALEMLAEAARVEGRRAKGRPPAWLERARDHLRDRFAENLRIADLAREAQVHPVYLASEFRRHFQCTVGDFVRRLRVEYACREIVAGDTPLVDIALGAGFADQGHFNRVFKRITGMTPGQYRSTFGCP